MIVSMCAADAARMPTDESSSATQAVGATLIAEGLDQHFPKGYIYFAMAFSVFVEMLNLKISRRPAAPVKLRERYAETEKKPTV